jgi:hypothetical protein
MMVGLVMDLAKAADPVAVITATVMGQDREDVIWATATDPVKVKVQAAAALSTRMVTVFVIFIPTTAKAATLTNKTNFLLC